MQNCGNIYKKGEIMAFSNQEKSQHGKNAQANLSTLLNSCKKNNYIENFKSNYRVGKDGYTNKTQFYAPFIISFANGENWILFSTTSMRTDRIKGQQWDAYNLKNINPLITKAFLVYSDDVSKKDIEEFERQNKKYLSKTEYSCIDEILSQDKLFNLIEKNATLSCNNGQIKDIQGRNFETRIALCLSCADNLKKWKNSDKTITGIHFPIFESILNSLNLEKELIQNIDATTDKKIIGKLPSNGNPKTDVYVKITFSDSTTKTITISCKRSSSEKVSVHQYSANSFSEILDSTNQTLNKLLQSFQETPSLSAFGEKNIEDLTKELKPYNDKLAKWVLAGVGGYGDPDRHWATHILTYDNNSNSISFHSIDEYINLLNQNNITGNFGTYFSWTYPSKQRGKSIQLKCKIIR